MYHVTLNHKPEPLNPKLYNIVGPWRVLGVGVCAQLVAIQQDYDYSEMWSMVAGMANNSMKEEVFATMILPTKLLVTETCPTRHPSEQSQTITIPRCQVSSVPKWMIMSPSKTSKRGTNAYMYIPKYVYSRPEARNPCKSWLQNPEKLCGQPA